MVSPQIIKRYPFFGGISEEHIKDIAMLGDEEVIEAGEVLYETGEYVDELFLVENGEFGLYIQVTDHSVDQSIPDQLLGTVKMENVLVSTVGPGDLVGWSALIPPHEATASVKALVESQVIVLDGEKLRAVFAQDRNFECKMTMKVAQVIRQRLTARQVESLAFKSA